MHVVVCFIVYIISGYFLNILHIFKKFHTCLWLKSLPRVYAMMSIGVLGFVVWSQWLAFPFSDSGVTNFAICWNVLVLIGTFYSKNSISYVKSAGNLNCIVNYAIDKSSSETTRETSFNFSTFRKYIVNINNISDSWLIWFVGFTEGDGALLTYNNTCSFVITQKEEAILHHIRDTLNIGYVKNFGKFSRFIVRDKQSILMLIHIFNGNLFFDKRKKQLYKWLAIFNVNISKNEFVPTVNDAWLSGLIDAEGCFNVSLFKRKSMALGYQVKMRFMIDQKDSLKEMTYLKNILNLFLTYRTDTMHRIESNSLLKVPITLKYIDVYNLKSKKKESYNKWKNIYYMVLDKQHLNQEGLNNIKILSKEINLITSVTRKTGNKQKMKI